jgi:hypothetical protein
MIEDVSRVHGLQFEDYRPRRFGQIRSALRGAAGNTHEPGKILYQFKRVDMEGVHRSLTVVQ